jgi:PRTRC genetic system protein E
MFQQLMPLLRHRSVLLTVTHVGEDQVRVNVVPKKIAESENDALTTPMSFIGTAEELDAQLGEAIVSFVASHLELKNTLARAKEEMDAAAKAAKQEAANKSKTAKKALPVEAPARKEQKAAEPPTVPGLFDVPAGVCAKPTLSGDADEEAEILAEIKENEITEQVEEAVSPSSRPSGWAQRSIQTD